MGVRWKLGMMAGLSALMVIQAAQAGAPVTFSGSFTKSFSPTVIPLNGTSTVTYTVTNTAATPVNDLAFTDTFSTGLEVVSSATAPSACGGLMTPTLGPGGSIAVSGGIVPANDSCSYSAEIRGKVLGTHAEATPAITSTSHLGMPLGGAVVPLSVVAATGVPTLSEWGLIALLLAMAGSALHAIRRSRLGK